MLRTEDRPPHCAQRRARATSERRRLLPFSISAGGKQRVVGGGYSAVLCFALFLAARLRRVGCGEMEAVADCFGHMGQADRFCSVKIGKGARNAQDAVIAAG